MKTTLKYNDMAQPKGQSGNPAGRPKGTPNKVTSSMRKWIEAFLNKKLPDLEADFDKLDKYQKWLVVEKLLQYTIPKMQSISLAEAVDEATKANEERAMKALTAIIEQTDDATLDKIYDKMIQQNEND